MSDNFEAIAEHLISLIAEHPPQQQQQPFE
jgi:hypothetical protein